jgi:AcrR family transcriptional regulator
VDATSVNAADGNETVTRILDGALRALGRHGLKRLSMGDVSAEAGVSRGTVYRYFANREQLLEAVSHHVQRGYETGIDKAVAENPGLEVRVQVVMDFLAWYSKRPEILRLYELQPIFVLDYLQRELPQFIKKTGEVLRPALEQAAVVRSGQVDAAFFTELVQRVMMSNYLLGGADPSVMAKQLSSFWDAVADS